MGISIFQKPYVKRWCGIGKKSLARLPTMYCLKWGFFTKRMCLLYCQVYFVLSEIHSIFLGVFCVKRMRLLFHLVFLYSKNFFIPINLSGVICISKQSLCSSLFLILWADIIFSLTSFKICYWKFFIYIPFWSYERI